MGARFAKWRAVITVGDGIPSRGCVEANAQALARYAALCQEAGLVPVVGPEVLMEGDHSINRCREFNGRSPQGGLRRPIYTGSDAGGYAPEAQYGAARAALR